MVTLIRKIAAVSGDTLAVFDNILKWIRLQLSGFTYQPVDCHAYDLLLTTLHQVESTAAEKKLEIVNQLPANCIVKADPEMLRTVFLHILQLSVHYSQPGRSLLIITWTIAPVIYIRFVVDTGIGATDVITSLSKMLCVVQEKFCSCCSLHLEVSSTSSCKLRSCIKFFV